ncbi:PGPGW domain-containing protein [Pseudokineococcus sp. 1T1Z-3]|uniref:PGPGW domain-containing protein n=1 Tax=Pseudokineococcus sp. 1T1Z-3 TaxID=3132745 RepID=UPI0030A5177E
MTDRSRPDGPAGVAHLALRPRAGVVTCPSVSGRDAATPPVRTHHEPPPGGLPEQLAVEPAPGSSSGSFPGPLPAAARARRPRRPQTSPGAGEADAGGTHDGGTDAGGTGVGVPAEEAGRWRRWRHQLRQERPRAHLVYRVGVGVVGGLLLVAWALVSWLPGPGGIPLLLLALAVLSTEFSWAHRLLERARRGAHRFGSWSTRQPRWARVLGSAALVVVVASALALGLALAVGLPDWVPPALSLQLDRLPGVDAAR